MNPIPLRSAHLELSSIDDASLSVMFSGALARDERDLQELLLQQFVLRSVPIIHRAVRDADPSIDPRDLNSLEDEALIKVLARLSRDGGNSPAFGPLAYEIGRECAMDKDRHKAPAPKISPSRPKLRIIHG
jgi:hypothetical protein